jgi:uncharacterized caspase-like protein
LFFYAGHGLQVAGHNYLVPIDAKAESEDALDWEMLKVEIVHRAMERSANTNILFLDACRDNPLARNLSRAMGTRSSSVGRGLATIESGVGTLISFSTQPGNVAADGTGRNSPFAGALVKQLSSSTDDLSAMLIAVRNDVMKETQRKQIPWEHSALTGRFYFATPNNNVPGAGSSGSGSTSSGVEGYTVENLSSVTGPTLSAITLPVDASKPEPAVAACARHCDAFSTSCAAFDLNLVYGRCTLYSEVKRKGSLGGFISGVKVAK